MSIKKFVYFIRLSLAVIIYKYKKLSSNTKYVMWVVAICILVFTSFFLHRYVFSPTINYSSILSESKPTSINKSGVGNEVSITLAGEIMCHDGQLIDSKVTDENVTKYDFSSCFHEILPYIVNSDLSIASLDGVVVEDSNAKGYPDFFIPQSMIKELGKIGFDAFSLADIQSTHRSEEGILYTGEVLRNEGISPFGTSFNKNKPVILTQNGIKIGLISSVTEEYINQTAAEDQVFYDLINVYSSEKIKEDIASCKQEGADYIIIYIKWGDGTESVPTSQMESMAKGMIAAGADFIVGGGSHIVMPIEQIECVNPNDPSQKKMGYVAYSLGNFISNQRTDSKDIGTILKVVLRKTDYSTTYVSGISYTPIYTNVDIEDGKNFKVIPVNTDTAPSWMDEYNSERYIQANTIVNAIVPYRLNTSPYFFSDPINNSDRMEWQSSFQKTN